MRMLTPYKQFTDRRGAFLGIVNSDHWEEFNYVETKAGEQRGGHYHKETRELFYIIDGEIDVSIKDLKQDPPHTFHVGPGAIFVIDPFEIHVFTCRTACRWINVLSRRIDDQFHDIHVP